MLAVLRIGHRVPRDLRMTTHVALVARAFGADKIFIDAKDDKIQRTIRSVCTRFGGGFEIETGVSPKLLLRQWTGTIVHLTMYGEPLRSGIEKIHRDGDVLIIVGAEKVPPYIYQCADVNIAVGHQPHSEVAALALFLDRFTNEEWENKQFHGRLEIQPCIKGKRVVTHDE